jgi:BirA family transcriptional regulator, biotin operon repressor / biotin---[acetyl-CoA-carboxylase] ligase
MSMRSAVLQALKDKEGLWVSGEALSEILQVSRTTIWKQVRSLTAEGYEIEAAPKKGYRISGPADLLSAEEVVPGLITERFGRRDYFYYREVDSTNNQARLLAAQGYPEGTVVVAEMQTAGRGRRGRSWFSPAGQGIYVSLILRPVLPLKEISRITLAAAVAAAETLGTVLHLHPRIKWPNDILVNGRKIVGILSEAVTDTDGIEYIVVGIGVNINNPRHGFPADFCTAATSARAEYDHPASRIQVLRELLWQMENRYNQILAGNFTPILNRVKELSVVIGQEVRLDTVSGFIEGLACDIDESGFLLVRDRFGKIHTVMSGEVIILPPGAAE